MTISEKQTLILEQEKRFANALAMDVIGKPKISFWMILIPIILIFHVHQHQKYRAGRQLFAENYFISRKRAVEEAFSIVTTGREPDIDELVKLSSLPETAKKEYADFLTVLVEHYADLLRAEGENFESLVKSAYRSQTNFLLFLNRLNQVEKSLNKSLEPHISQRSEEIEEVVGKIEQCSEILRRNIAAHIFCGA
jgi:hypothetical protein